MDTSDFWWQNYPFKRSMGTTMETWILAYSIQNINAYRSGNENTFALAIHVLE